MADLLNLDELVSAKRVVTIKGTEYTLADQTVDQMLAGIKKAKDAQENDGDRDVEDVLADMKKTCQTVLPECPAKIIGGLSMKQTIALIEFAARSDEEVETAVEEAGEEKQGK